MTRTRFLFLLFALLVATWLGFKWGGRIMLSPVPSPEEREERRRASARTRPSDAERATAASAKKWRETLTAGGDLLSEAPISAAAEKNTAANELFSLPELPDDVVADLARMFRSPGEDGVRATPSTLSTPSTLAETAAAVSADPSASPLLRATAEAIGQRTGALP